MLNLSDQKILISDAELSRMMYQRGIRPSLLRLAVLSQVANTRKHPTADDVFSELSSLYPSMSRTTVYNSLNLMVKSGIIKEVEVESGVRHYDYALQPQHSHFVCRFCGRIYDMDMPEAMKEIELQGFDIEDMDVVFKGQCPECKINNTNI